MLRGFDVPASSRDALETALVEGVSHKCKNGLHEADHDPGYEPCTWMLCECRCHAFAETARKSALKASRESGES